MTLDDWLLEDRPLPARYRVIESLCEIVQATHGRGDTHGAIKPENVEVTSDLQSELDFDHPTPLLSSDVPNYRAPELAPGAGPTAKSDIFSVGVVMYQVLTGSHPFVVDTPMGRVPTDLQPPALRQVRPDVSRDLADAITACIERDPEWRPNDLGYVLEVLRRLRGDFGPAAAKAAKPSKTGSRPVARPAGKPAERAAPATPMFSRPAAASRSFPIMPVVIGGGLVLAVGVGLWLRSVLSEPGVAGPSPTPTALAAVPSTAPSAMTVATPVATPPPPVSAGPPTPAPLATPTPQALPSAPAATPTPLPAPTARAVATPEPSPTPTAIAMAPTPAPAATPQDTPTPVAVGPAELTAVAPFKVRSNGPALLDVHGRGLRPDHQAVLLKGRAGVPGFVVTRTRFMNQGLIMVFVRLDNVVPGKYSLGLTDASGILTNQLRLEVEK
jgi:eukaryotic-like serine/threonine-protein kinase